TACPADGEFRLRDLATGAELLKLERKDNFLGSLSNPAAVSADGSAAAVSGQTGVRVYDLATGRIRHEFQPQFPIWGLALSPGGRYLAVRGRTGRPDVGDPRDVPTFWLFDLTTRRQLPHVNPEKKHQEKMLFSPDARLLATTTLQGTVHVWELATGRERARFAGHLPGEITSLGFAPDGR